MFPRELADGLFSLRLGKPTSVVSIHMTLAADGSLADYGLQLSKIQPTRRLTYAEVDELLHETMPEQEPALWALHKVHTCLLQGLVPMAAIICASIVSLSQPQGPCGVRHLALMCAPPQQPASWLHSPLTRQDSHSAHQQAQPSMKVGELILNLNGTCRLHYQNPSLTQQECP